jgi:hypothetical protein
MQPREVLDILSITERLKDAGKRENGRRVIEGVGEYFA